MIRLSTCCLALATALLAASTMVAARGGALVPARIGT